MVFGRYKDRPIIRIERETIDYVLELIAIIALSILIILPIFFYAQLPDDIPRHYGSDGMPDAYGSKSSIWVLSIIGLVLYVLLLKLNNCPHKFNYPQKVTEENAHRLYKTATRMMRLLYTFINMTFAYMIYTDIHVALGKRDGLGQLFTPLVIIIMLCIVGYALKDSLSKK